ncbi:MAG TPA: potassium transporter TrkA [Bacteroidetes bacterium]|nr:potassium transporter TrkA [Bacteroidota bacterium]
MKFISSQVAYFFQNRRAKTNIARLVRFILVLVGLIILYSVIFHYIMELEGRDYSWISGFYWTLTVMSTLGFGDITFNSDLGRMFSLIVLLSGIVFLLVMLPFTFIQFFYAPWLEAQNRSRAPRELPSTTKNHVIITNFDPVTKALIEKLTSYNYNYVLIIADLQNALNYSDMDYNVMVGELDDPNTYRKARIENAALLVATGSDMLNTNITFTANEISDKIKVASIANSPDSVDILKLAGSEHVLQLGVMMGQSLARRTIGGNARVHVIGRFDQLVIGEAPATGTPLVGKTLAESKLREAVGVNVVGLWERGKFISARPDTLINVNSVLVLAGSVDQLRNYDDFFGIYNIKDGPVIIIGAGRVGRATAKSLNDRKMDFVVVEKDPVRAKRCGNYVVGDAADREILYEAGMETAHTVIITTHDDDTNIYLTLYCRKLRPDLKIIARSTLDRNVSTLHRAGADFVMSYASMGSNAIFNILQRDEVLMIAEGLNVFRMDVPTKLIGKTIKETDIRRITGCSIIAINQGDGLLINPDPMVTMNTNSEIILIGSQESEKLFVDYINE